MYNRKAIATHQFNPRLLTRKVDSFLLSCHRDMYQERRWKVEDKMFSFKPSGGDKTSQSWFCTALMTRTLNPRKSPWDCCWTFCHYKWSRIDLLDRKGGNRNTAPTGLLSEFNQQVSTLPVIQLQSDTLHSKLLAKYLSSKWKSAKWKSAHNYNQQHSKAHDLEHRP